MKMQKIITAMIHIHAGAHGPQGDVLLAVITEGHGTRDGVERIHDRIRQINRQAACPIKQFQLQRIRLGVLFRVYGRQAFQLRFAAVYPVTDIFRFGDRSPVSQLYLIRRSPEIAAAVARIFLRQAVQGKGSVLAKRRGRKGCSSPALQQIADAVIANPAPQ